MTESNSATHVVVPDVTVLLTGGTFDKVYDVVRERFTFGEGSAFYMIAERSYIGNVSVRTLFKVDSLDMEDPHRAKIVDAIETAATDRILIVHGTSTLLQTAEHLHEQFGKGKTIILTGALKPASYDGLEAAANIGTAICAARYFPGGVFVAIHGVVVRPDLLIKDRDSARFVMRSSQDMD